ncbi:electron transfer flavoprotein subunit alpha/FixB family protein [Oceanidesulfovibrio marinus]|uniref:Electron transfer flavoprotein subunit alpha/FixB family protein n=1 Tax=Oceanidesulfovibrio marinus TaxID=370038 RepID=A0A6P1ZL95_9BACT|nr:electron transfer flavoprotein subunit alpha/FixB family protein [Oceanidesulfovibrio marinus]QJT07580.1 electron transfer flavoprotein subunit alpha/FixB family protein [Oceanidesulfovibrio marinus]TVM34506.1 electron transfer flavoprotein subunit alpha/FixB family protein [Oceanidesulfovibrio marinus]
MTQIFAYIAHKDGVADDTALELLTAAAAIAPNAPVTAIVAGNAPQLDAVAEALAQGFAEVWKFSSDSLAQPNAEIIRPVLASALPAGSIVLMGHDTFAMDMAPGLSIKRDVPFVSDVVGVDGLAGDVLTLVRQEYGGQVSAHVQTNVAGGAVLTLRAGSFAPAEGAGSGQIVDKSGEIGEPAMRRVFLEMAAAEVDDVDISKEDVLVSIGRGIGDEENIEIAQELAEAMGGVVACSRPIVDARWMNRSRQVGTSGQTVKPKVYLACGISGSFQHLGGIKGSPFIVAINTNPKAPIFQAADVGIVADILDFLPELTEAINGE